VGVIGGRIAAGGVRYFTCVSGRGTNRPVCYRCVKGVWAPPLCTRGTRGLVAGGFFLLQQSSPFCVSARRDASTVVKGLVLAVSRRSCG